MASSDSLHDRSMMIFRYFRAPKWYGDQFHPILSGDLVVAAFNRQNVLDI
jgi:hypothetical protein